MTQQHANGVAATAKTADGGCNSTQHPRFENTYCSQCGKDLGPGDSGVSCCCDHGCCPVQSIGEKCECYRAGARKERDVR